MGEDHLDKEVSISAELTETGVTARAKSRAIAAIDRLIGSAIDSVVAPLEGKVAEARASSEARVKILQAWGDIGVERLKRDPDFVAMALESHVQQVIRKHERKEIVVTAMLEDLSKRPPSEQQSGSGPEAVSEGFINRFERYAEEATEEDIRAKWGKILAAEIRQPGLVAPKVMRILDEIDVATAVLFERFCENRIAHRVPKCLSGTLSFEEIADLVTADLIVDPGLTGQIQLLGNGRDAGGVELWFLNGGKFGAGIPRGAEIPDSATEDEASIIRHEDAGGVPVYVLTKAGHAIASIFEDKQEQAWTAYFDALTSSLREIDVRDYRLNGDSYRLVATIRKVANPAQSEA